MQAQAGEAVSEVQRAWRKHEAVRRELMEARTAWAAERQELQAQVQLLKQQLRQQARRGAAGSRGGVNGIGGGDGSGGNDGFPVNSEDVASIPPGGEPLSTVAMLLPPPPWELQSASSIASWQVATCL